MAQFRQSPFSNLTPVVKNLLIINVIFYIASWSLRSFIFTINGYSYDVTTLLSAHYFNSPFFKPWQIITYMFMHGSIEHIFFNMLGLFMFGPMLEYILGSKRFLNFYFICGLGALAIQMAAQAYAVHQIVGRFTIPNGDYNLYADYPIYEHLKGEYQSVILGASGSIFGILVAFAMIFPNVEMMLIFLPIPIKAKYLVTGYIAIELFEGFTGLQGDVAHFAHIGGALLGFIMIRKWGLHSRDKFF